PLICKVDGVCISSWETSPFKTPKISGEEPKEIVGSSDTSIPSSSAAAWNWSFICFAVNHRMPNSARRTMMSTATKTPTMVFHAVAPADLVFAITTSLTDGHRFEQCETASGVTIHSQTAGATTSQSTV